MQCFYSGWNGFGQMPNHAESAVTSLSKVETEEPINSVSCSWSALCLVSGSRVYVSGFIDGAVNISKPLFLENRDTFHQVVNNSKHIVAICNSKKIWRRSTAAGEENPKFSFISLGELTNEDSEDFVEKVSCSDNVCAALTTAGNLYAIPSRINNPGLVVTDVACGNEHTVFVTSAGSVYTFGQGSRGQLGHGELEAEEEPREVDALAGIKMRQVSCGGWHCAVVSEQGDLYTWGWNRHGQLGVQEEPVQRAVALQPTPKKQRCELSLQTENTVKYYPRDVPLVDLTTASSSTEERAEFPFENCVSNDGSGGVYALPQLVGWTEKNVVLVSCGTRHTVALLEDGTLWGCGWNAYGQLGISPKVYYQRSSMTQIPMPTQGKVKRVVCGGWSTCVLVASSS